MKDDLSMIVDGDLRTLVELFNRDEIDDYVCSASSSILRRLLIEGVLSQHRRRVGLKRQPRITALDLVKWVGRPQLIFGWPRVVT